MGQDGEKVGAEKEGVFSNTLLTHDHLLHMIYFHVCVYDVYMCMYGCVMCIYIYVYKCP